MSGPKISNLYLFLSMYFSEKCSFFVNVIDENSHLFREIHTQHPEKFNVRAKNYSDQDKNKNNNNTEHQTHYALCSPLQAYAISNSTNFNSTVL